MSDSDEPKYRDKIEVLLFKHVAYFDHLPWPKPETEEWGDLVRTWADAFGGERISPAKLERAIVAIRKAPPEFKPEHLPELLRIVREADDNPARPDGPGRPGSPENAEPCPTCSDQGMAILFRRDYTGSPVERRRLPDGTSRTVLLRTAAPCTCPKGRWIFAKCRSDGTKVLDADRPPAGWGFDDPTDPAPTERPASRPSPLRVGRNVDELGFPVSSEAPPY